MGETGQTVTYLYYLILLFQITCIPAFCNTLFFRQFTVKLIRLQLSSSTFQSCKYALITLITLGYFPSLHQQHIYNHVFVLSHSQSHSEPISKFPGHLTQPGLWLHLFLKFDLFCQGPIIDSFFFSSRYWQYYYCFCSTNVFPQAVWAKEGIIDKMIKLDNTCERALKVKSTEQIWDDYCCNLIGKTSGCCRLDLVGEQHLRILQLVCSVVLLPHISLPLLVPPQHKSLGSESCCQSHRDCFLKQTSRWSFIMSNILGKTRLSSSA